jgi:nucleoid DNA-binding protein
MMNKQEIVAKISKDTGISKVSAAAAVHSLIDGITRSLKKGDAVSFVGFGTFKTANRKARTARNPQTGAAIKIPKRRVPRFSAGKALKQAVR